jgi:hypothetical protein
MAAGAEPNWHGSSSARSPLASWAIGTLANLHTPWGTVSEPPTDTP